MIRTLSYACVALLLWNSEARSQDLQEELAKALQLHQDGEWESATQVLNHLLETGQLTRSQRTQARQALAEAYVFLKHSDQAVEVYKQLVRDDRTFNMRSLGEDPDARLLWPFGKAVLEVRDEELKALETQYSQTSRRSALLRSTLLPGWGQRYQGYRWRGHVMLGLVVSSVAYAVVSEQSFRKARDYYDQAPITTTREEFESLYNDYDNKATLADLALGVASSVWAANVLDAAFQRPALVRPLHALQLGPIPGRAGMQVALVAKF